MKKMSWSLGLFVLIVAISCRQKDNLTREEVIKAIERFDIGWKNKDSTIVDSVLSPSYIYFTQSGGIFSRSNIMFTTISSEYQLKEMDRGDFVIRLAGNTAVVSTIWKGKGTYRGSEFDDHQRCSVTIIKNKGRVQILSEHCTPISN
jgi:hypothetical protein